MTMVFDLNLILLLCLICILVSAENAVPECAQCCSTQSIDRNNSQIHSIVQTLRNTTFFKIFKVNLNEKCDFWPDNSMCHLKSCSVFDCNEEEIPAPWKMEKSDPVDRSLNMIQFEHWNENDQNWIHKTEEGVASYINLQHNPESYTAFQGPDAARIWNAIYLENCFLKQSNGAFDPSNLCYEERVFYRIISGLQAEIGCHIAYNYASPSGKFVPNTAVFEEKVGNHPDRIANIFFVFVFLSRAVHKAAPLLLAHSYNTGDELESARTLSLVKKLLDSSSIQQCSPEQSFDESTLFKDPKMAPRLLEFKKNFRNISRIIDCVGCEKCRLHGKLQILGLGTALKILFAPNVKTIKLQRNEIIALINTLGKFSHAIYIIQEMQKMVFQRKVLKNTLYGLGVMLSLLVLYIIYKSCCKRTVVDYDKKNS